MFLVFFDSITLSLFRRMTPIPKPSYATYRNQNLTMRKQLLIQPLCFSLTPNKNAFLLGEWYWNGSAQKTKEGFKQLLEIISDSSFNPSEIRNIPWDSLNKCLAESSDSESMWLDEPDAGWKESSITLSIPFPKRAQHPGPQPYTFPPFRHRNIVSVLKEKMTNAKDFSHFHLEPYELRVAPQRYARCGIHQSARRIIHVSGIPRSS